MFTHLVIGGGGIKGISFLGAIKILIEKGLLDKVETYIGSSVGGVIAFLLNISYNWEELLDVFLNIDFNKFKNIEFSGIFENYGLDDCSSIMTFFKAMTKQKNISLDITFQELYDETTKTLVITGSDILNNKVEYYSWETTPKMKILDAIRITISFPIIYHPVISDGKILSDGGILDPYPMNYIKDKKDKIGITLLNKNYCQEICSFEDYIISIMNCMMEQFEKLYMKDFVDETIFIEIPEIFSMNLDITREEKLLIFNRGGEAAKEYLDKREKK